MNFPKVIPLLNDIIAIKIIRFNYLKANPGVSCDIEEESDLAESINEARNAIEILSGGNSGHSIKKN